MLGHEARSATEIKEAVVAIHRCVQVAHFVILNVVCS